MYAIANDLLRFFGSKLGQIIPCVRNAYYMKQNQFHARFIARFHLLTDILNIAFVNRV